MQKTPLNRQFSLITISQKLPTPNQNGRLNSPIAAGYPSLGGRARRAHGWGRSRRASSQALAIQHLMAHGFTDLAAVAGPAFVSPPESR